MDQSVIAGIGNVYRAEFLFMSGQNPFVRGADVPRERFDEIWEHAVWFLREGSKDGMIRTVDPHYMTGDERSVPLKYMQTSYVYKRTGQLCRLCGDTIVSDDHAGRTLYWCPTCQK
jgi:endonuclease-8